MALSYFICHEFDSRVEELSYEDNKEYDMENEQCSCSSWIRYCGMFAAGYSIVFHKYLAYSTGTDYTKTIQYIKLDTF